MASMKIKVRKSFWNRLCTMVSIAGSICWVSCVFAALQHTVSVPRGHNLANLTGTQSNHNPPHTKHQSVHSHQRRWQINRVLMEKFFIKNIFWFWNSFCFPASFWNAVCQDEKICLWPWLHLSKFSSSRSGRGKFGVLINGISANILLRSALVCVMERSYFTSSIKQDMDSFISILYPVFWIFVEIVSSKYLVIKLFHRRNSQSFLIMLLIFYKFGNFIAVIIIVIFVILFWCLSYPWQTTNK